MLPRRPAASLLLVFSFISTQVLFQSANAQASYEKTKLAERCGWADAPFGGRIAWCAGSCGPSCKQVCEGLRSNLGSKWRTSAGEDVPPLSDARWFAAQNTEEKCAALLKVLGGLWDDDDRRERSVRMGDSAVACLEGAGKLTSEMRSFTSTRAGLAGDLVCSSNADCAPGQRDTCQPVTRNVFNLSGALLRVETVCASCGTARVDVQNQVCPCVYEESGLGIWGGQLLCGAFLGAALVGLARFAMRCVPLRKRTVGRVIHEFKTQHRLGSPPLFPLSRFRN
jgi:hypothetical protein